MLTERECKMQAEIEQLRAENAELKRRLNAPMQMRLDAIQAKARLLKALRLICSPRILCHKHGEWERVTYNTYLDQWNTECGEQFKLANNGSVIWL